MTKTTYRVDVSRTVDITIDTSKFTEEFYDQFTSLIDESMDEISSHIEHLAWLYAAGRIDNGDFIEGYGNAKEFGLSFRSHDADDYIDIMAEIK